MEHFFLYICSEIPTSDETTLVSNVIQSLLPQPEVLNHICTKALLPQLLRCDSVNASILNSYLTVEENVEWKTKDPEMTVTNFISNLVENVSKNQDAEIKDHSQNLSTHINYLADHLPSCGSFKLDVILNDDILREFSVSNDIEFASALYRLFRWHGSHTTLMVPEGTDCSSFLEWIEMMDAEFLEGMTDPSLKCVVWRGALKLAENGHLPSEIYPGFQLRLDVLESEIILEESVSTNSEDLEPEYLILSPTLSMVDECSFTSIPPYIFANAAFRLLITEPNMFNEKSSKFLDYLENKKGAAVIAQMGYSILMKKPKSDEFLNTNKWQKAISSGNIRLPEICLPIVDKCITFAITHSSKTGNIIAYPLRDTASLNAELVFLLTDNLNSKQDLNSSDSCDSDSDQALNCADLKFPHLSETVFYFLMNKINFLKMNKKENFNSEDLHSCLLSIQEHASEQLASCSLFENVNLYDILHDEIDPADWPERVHLLQKQMLIDDDKTNVLPKFLHTPSPQVQNNVCFTSEDADKYFHSSGEAKTSANAELISRLNKTLKPANVDYDNVLQSKWPEAIDLIYPDLYYNVDKQVEEKESVGNDMVRLYVQHETATTCNKQQVYPNAPIFVRTGTAAVKTVRKMKWRSPSKQILLPKKSLNLVYKTYVDSKRASVSNSKSSASVDPDAKSAKIEKPFKKQLKKPALPVRCSPRKKQPVVYSEVASRNSQTTQQKQSNSSDAAEIFKKKLRVAVATALEKNSIHINDAVFRPCFKKLFTICQAFVQDIPRKKGSTSEHMQKIADAHVKQVIQFEKQK